MTSIFYRELIQQVVSECRQARDAGTDPAAFQSSLLPAAIDHALSQIQPEPFINWIKEDRELSIFYYDVQQSGACAKPREVAAHILEAMVRDQFE